MPPSSFSLHLQNHPRSTCDIFKAEFSASPKLAKGLERNPLEENGEEDATPVLFVKTWKRKNKWNCRKRSSALREKKDFHDLAGFCGESPIQDQAKGAWEIRSII